MSVFDSSMEINAFSKDTMSFLLKADIAPFTAWVPSPHLSSRPKFIILRRPVVEGGRGM
jgi:hypothetical protein